MIQVAASNVEVGQMITVCFEERRPKMAPVGHYKEFQVLGTRGGRKLVPACGGVFRCVVKYVDYDHGRCFVQILYRTVMTAGEEEFNKLFQPVREQRLARNKLRLQQHVVGITAADITSSTSFVGEIGDIPVSRF